MTFMACEKERILPVNFDYQGEQYDGDCGFDDDESLNRGSDDLPSNLDTVTDPDEDEDFDGDDNVTDPDEDEDFDGDDNVTDPDEDEDFDGDGANGNNL